MVNEANSRKGGMKMNQNTKIGCVVMAAGNASRFRANKLLMDYQGKPLIVHALDAADCSCLDRVVVVTQYPQIEAMALARGYACRINHQPDLGASVTIRLGTEALQDCDGILYLVADQPRLTADTVCRIVAAWQAAPECIIAPVSDGCTGNPCIFPRSLFGELMALEADAGGKKVIRRHPELLRTVTVEASQLFDCDTPQALEELRRRSDG